MGKWLEGAKLVRADMDKAGAMLDNKQAVQVTSIYPIWRKGIVITQEEIDEGRNRYQYKGKLYFTNTPHTTIESWEPGVETASIWTIINLVNTGTIDDPIPAEFGLYYKEGLYYIENDIIYLCTRQDTENGTQLFHMPSALVGHYFEQVGV